MSKNDDFLTDYSLEGELLQIATFPDPVLKKKAQPVDEFNENLATLAKDMLYTMYKTPGVGLAAPQVSKSVRLFVMDIDYDREEITSSDQSKTEYRLSNFNPRVFINPVILKKDGDFVYEEGCLSVPGIFEEVHRAEHVVIEYYDLNGKKHVMEAAGLLSVCIQHENDHLDGIVFLERLSMLKRNLLTKKYLKSRKKEHEKV